MPSSRMTGRAIVVLVILLALGMSYVASMRAWLDQRSTTNELRTEIAERQTRVRALRQQKQRLNDPAYIRMLATEKFGWVMPGETGYTVLDAQGNPIDDGANQLTDPAATVVHRDPEWWQQQWSSVVQAGKTPAEVMREARLAREPARDPIDKIGGGGS